MTHGHIHFLPRRLWRVELVEAEGTYGVFSSDSDDQYVALDLDREQADFAVMLLEHDALGDASSMDQYDVRTEVEHQVRRRQCLRCGDWRMTGTLGQDGRCAACQA